MDIDSNTAMRALTCELTFFPSTDTLLDDGGEGSPCFLLIIATTKSFEDNLNRIIKEKDGNNCGDKRGKEERGEWRQASFIYGIFRLRVPRHHDAFVGSSIHQVFLRFPAGDAGVRGNWEFYRRFSGRSFRKRMLDERSTEAHCTLRTPPSPQ